MKSLVWSLSRYSSPNTYRNTCLKHRSRWRYWHCGHQIQYANQCRIGFQVFILVLTATSLGFNVWGSVLMRQEFNPLWFIPSSTYLSQFFTTMQDFYPSNGELATIYIKSDNLSQHLRDMDSLIATLNNQTDIIHHVDDWFVGFKEFVTTKQLIGTSDSPCITIVQQPNSFLSNFDAVSHFRYGNKELNRGQIPDVLEKLSLQHNGRQISQEFQIRRYAGLSQWDGASNHRKWYGNWINRLKLAYNEQSLTHSNYVDSDDKLWFRIPAVFWSGGTYSRHAES